MSNGDCPDGLQFAGGCDPSTGLGWDCPGQVTLQHRYAAEYAKLYGISAQYYVQKDQFERQWPGPGGPDVRPDDGKFDPLYGEPSVPVRMRSDDRVEEVWNFRDPVQVYVLIQERTIEREANERGGAKKVLYTIAMPVYAVTAACAAQLEADNSSIGIKDIARPGDVLFLEGKHQIWLDVDDDTDRKGFITPDLEHTWVEVSAVKRSKYVPSRKDYIPDKENYQPRSNADTGFETGEPWRAVEDHTNDPQKSWE